MANAASKRIAGQNEQYLQNFRIGLVLVNLLTWIIRFFLRRPILPALFPLTLYLTSLALTVGIYNHFHTIGHPRRDAKGQVLAGWNGQDLGGKGIVEWGWDLVYISWACALGSALFGSKVWYLFLIVPGFAGYKIITLVGPYVLPSLFRRSTSPVAAQGGGAAPANGAPREDGELSKRQAKLKARAEKGDKRIRSVERRQ